MTRVLRVTPTKRTWDYLTRKVGGTVLRTPLLPASRGGTAGVSSHCRVLEKMVCSLAQAKSQVRRYVASKYIAKGVLFEVLVRGDKD